MAMRLTGIYSGLDTESIIQELVAVKRNKVDSAKKEQTKLQWKQDKWKELNTKLLNLYNKTVANMRFTTDYAKKKTVSSDENAVSVLTGGNAMDGVQELNVKSLAKTAYMTGGELGSDVKMSTKMSDLGITADTSLSVEIGGETKTISITKDMAVGAVVDKLRGVGLNVNFDEGNHRFFIGAKESGESGDFTISGDDATLKALGLYVPKATDLENLTEAEKKEFLKKCANKIDGTNAVIELNGATFTSNTNVFDINGLTITCKAETVNPITITTQNDTDGIYDMVKNFLKEYNAVINELDKVYNADGAKDYEPLTDEEKEEMSESEIEKWENKIKDSLLRRDSTVSNIAGSLKQIMMSGVNVDGEQLYLSHFGISTLSYFNAPDNEKNAYHIDGDPDDASTSGNTDKLKAMIASDPNKVAEFFSQLSQNLYTKLGELSKSVEGYSSFNSFYADKKMKEEYNDYTSKIKDLEEKLTDYEDQWYAKFAAMETAMAKMQSNSSAVASLLGG